jgi:ElaA protein
VIAVAPTLEIDPATLYAILSLRERVFVVEQACPYWDLDGRDLEPGCLQLWHEGPGEGVVATARLLVDGDRRRVGRICTAESARNRGLASSLVHTALERSGDRAVILDAQRHLTGWYETFGFRPTGHEFVDVGIPHVEMVRDGGEPAAR